MRLIDADRLTDKKGVFSEVVNMDFKRDLAYVKIEDLEKVIDNSPTAYDMDKVLEQLEKKKKAALKLCDNNARYDAYCKAIEIVKSGGVVHGD